MGLFDAIAGQVLGGAQQQQHQGGLMDVIGGLINNPQTGGLTGLIQAFEKGGLGGVVSSWVGTGQNLPISADQLHAVLGSEQLQALAQKLGFSPQDLSQQLAHLLPQVVDQLTPDGAVPHDDAVGGLLGNLLSGLGQR